MNQKIVIARKMAVHIRVFHNPADMLHGVFKSFFNIISNTEIRLSIESSPRIILMVVVFPAPFGPRKPNTSPP